MPSSSSGVFSAKAGMEVAKVTRYRMPAVRASERSWFMGVPPGGVRRTPDGDEHRCTMYTTARGRMDVPPQRRRATPLDRSTVLAEAISVADEGGLAAVSMRALSARLGVVPMALYKHVSDRE